MPKAKPKPKAEVKPPIETEIVPVPNPGRAHLLMLQAILLQLRANGSAFPGPLSQASAALEEEALKWR